MKQFQDVLAPMYQLEVFEGQQGLLWFKDRDLNDAPKKIALLKVEQHFHALTSIPALLNRSYYCHHCERAYNDETAEKHNCQGQNCIACQRKNKTCPNFATFVDPHVYCKDCNRKFYGQDCYDAHKRRKTENSISVCQRLVKCPECCKEYKPNRKKKHVCGVHYCRNCDADVLLDHPCYIQPIAEKKKNTEEEQEIEVEEEDGAGEGDGGSEEKAPPIVCVIDFECAKDENLEFEDVRVGWQYIGRETGYREAGTAKDLLKDLMVHTITADKKERTVFVFAHNMRGFDSSFILYALYGMGYKIVKMLSMGAKYLSFQCGDMIFRDSLNFFNMPLEKLPATFNLRELHKGFFPYSWICPEKCSYIGEYPPAEDYNPGHTSEKR